MEGKELQGNHTEDTLEAVHGAGQLDHFICKLGTLGVVPGAQYNRATLKQRNVITKCTWSPREAIPHTHPSF